LEPSSDTLAVMHPFPPAPALKFFVGETLAQISLDPFQVRFAFESGRALVSEERIEHVLPDGQVWRYECEAAQGAPLLLHRLLQQSVNAVEREDLCLSLTVGDHSVLRVFSELGPYESGHFEGPDGRFTVF